jgi:hypothetical protein
MPQLVPKECICFEAPTKGDVSTIGDQERCELPQTRHVGGTDKSEHCANPMLRARKRRPKETMVKIYDHKLLSKTGRLGIA